MKLKLLSLSCLISTTLTSQEPVIYDLGECIKIGLERNFSLLIAKNSETIAKNNFTLGNAGFLPSLNFTSRYGGTLNDTKQNLTDGSQNISSGISNTNSSAGVTMDLTIFNGFSVQTTYKKLNELKQIGELSTQLAIENLLADIISGYYNFVQQIELLNNIEYAVALSKERLRIDEDRYLLGSSSKLSVLQSRVYLNADSSRLSRQFEVVRAAGIRLNELMALDDLGSQFISRDTSISVNPELLYEKLLEETLLKNTSLMIASKNKTISEYDYRIIASRSYPYLTASSGYNYSYNTFGAGSSKNQQTNGLSYGLTLGMNIFDGLNQRRNIHNSAIDVKSKELRYRSGTGVKRI
jgi:outer membrane protein TolC